MCVQDDDGYMFRVQPADIVAPGRAGVVRWQRLGRHGPGAARGEHPAPKARWKKGFIGAGVLCVTTEGLLATKSRYSWWGFAYEAVEDGLLSGRTDSTSVLDVRVVGNVWFWALVLVMDGRSIESEGWSFSEN